MSIAEEYERAKSLVQKKDTPDGRKSFLLWLLNGSHVFNDQKTKKQWNLNDALQQFISQLGILALSKTATDPLLWSHYSDGHKGVCLEFDSTRLSINEAFISDDVQYAEKPPYVDLFLSLVEELGEFVKPWDNQPYPIEQGDSFYTRQLSKLMRANLLVKSQKWRYEEEYRMVASKPGAKVFDPIALKKVICGMKIQPCDVTTIRNILSHPKFAHVELEHVAHLQGSFDFTVSPMNL